tara:strand:+ start:40475 stop:40690 length:216 start_codon:yes stop_codon:yes gene_type:complete
MKKVKRSSKRNQLKFSAINGKEQPLMFELISSLSKKGNARPTVESNKGSQGTQFLQEPMVCEDYDFSSGTD